MQRREFGCLLVFLCPVITLEITTTIHQGQEKKEPEGLGYTTRQSTLTRLNVVRR